MDAIGLRRRRLALQAASLMPDGAGGGETSWATVANVFAAVVATGGETVHAAMGDAGHVRFRVTLRHRDDATVGRRFVDGARVLTIRAAFDPDGTRRWLVCLCEAAP